MPTIAQLNQRHPCVDVERLKDLEALYDGDELMQARLHKFLPQREREKPQRYQLRKDEWHYRNYLGPIIDYFASMLFVSSPVISASDKSNKDEKLPDPGEYYTEIREDCDGNGCDIDAFFKDRLTDAMVGGCSWIRLKPRGDQSVEVKSMADFEAAKLGDSWLVAPDHLDVLDWDTDDTGRLTWAITHRRVTKRASIDASRNQVTETWEHLLPDRVDTYEITYEADKPPQGETEVPKKGSEAHRYGSVPIICLELPRALWVASRLRTPQLAHFRALNAQSWSLSCTAYAMPVAKVKDPEEFAKHLHGAGYGVVIGVEEDWGWEAPPTGHFAALDTEIKAHKDEIFRIAHQMALGVENNAAAVGRSAESKASDMESTRVALVAYSRIMKECIERVFDMLSRAHGDDYVWSVEGLDDFAALDVAGLVETLGMVQTAGGIPSRTFDVQMKTRLAESLLRDVDEATKATIREEIKENTPEPMTEVELEVERFKALNGVIGGGHPEPGKPGGDGAAGPGNKKPPAGPGAGKRPPFPKPS
jgi:hypothetical protein